MAADNKCFDDSVRNKLFLDKKKKTQNFIEAEETMESPIIMRGGYSLD